MDINQVAMTVIMNACSGRDKVDESFASMAENDYEKAEALLAAADKDILEAHRAQTEVIQAQAGGEDTEYSLLFIHAQDTIMTSDAQLRIAKNMMPVLKQQYELIKQLKEKTK